MIVRASARFFATSGSYPGSSASLSAGSALLEAATTSQRAVIQQWDTAAHGAQQAALEAFRAQARATSRLFDPTPAGR